MNCQHRAEDLVEALCWRMVRAEWLEYYRVVRHTGVETVWTNVGCCRKKMLSQVIQFLELDRDSNKEFEFPSETAKLDDPAANDFEVCARALWVACMDELEIDQDPGAVKAFVRIVSAGETNPRECLIPLDDSDALGVVGANH